MKAGIGINGCRLNEPGGFVIVNNGGVWLWDGAEQLERIVSDVAGTKCQLNDCIADAAGRLLAGSYFYDPTQPYELGELFRIDTDGTATILDEGFHLANGLGFSPDQKTLYFADSAARVIYAYAYDVTGGTVRNRREFVIVPGSEGLPDGLAIDAEGFIWSAQWYGGSIVRYDPDGAVERRVEVPAKQTSSLAFGGPDMTDIFITSAARSEPMPVMPPGYDPEIGPFGGQLFRVNAGIKGQPLGRTAFRGTDQRTR